MNFNSAVKQTYHTNSFNIFQVPKNISITIVYNIASNFKGDANMNKDKFLTFTKVMQ